MGNKPMRGDEFPGDRTKDEPLHHTSTQICDLDVDPDPEKSVDAYGKLLTWLVEMADGDDVDLSDPNVIQQFQISASGGGGVGEKSAGYWSESVESHDSSENPQYSKASTRSCDDIEEETCSLLPDNAGDVRPKSLRASPSQMSSLKKTTLTKQFSIPYTKARSESPQYKRSSKSFSDLEDSVSFKQNLQEQILMQSQKRSKQLSRKRNRFIKQYSESHADYTVHSPVSFHQGYRHSSVVCESSDDIETKISGHGSFCSRQTTFSDDDDDIISDRHQSNRRPIFTESLEIDESESSILNDRRKRKGRFAGMMSRSLGNLMEKSSKIRNSIRRKSSSLFTVRSVEEPETSGKSTNAGHDKILDDKLLDGNIADILLAVDALWPKK